MLFLTEVSCSMVLKHKMSVTALRWSRKVNDMVIVSLKEVVNTA